MIKRVLVSLAVGLALTAHSHGAAAQSLGLGPRIGTLGLGGEVAVAVTERVVLRGGLGIVPFEPTMTFGDLDVSLSVPTVYNVGVDLYLNSAFRIGGGLLWRASDPEVVGEFTQPTEIGGTTFTPQELGVLRGVFDSNDRAPYVLIGFGNHTDRGVGLFIDLGVAFMGEPTVRLGTEGGTLSDDSGPLRTALDQEAAEFEEDMGSYLRFWPILNFGIRLGAY